MGTIYAFRQASLTFTLNPNSSHVSYFAQTRKTTPVILILQSVFCAALGSTLKSRLHGQCVWR